MARAGKARRAGVRKEEAGFSATKAPGVPRSGWCESSVEEEREGTVEREMLFIGLRRKGEPERSERPKRARVPTRTNPPGSEKGYGFWGEREPLERRIEAVRGFGRKRKSGADFREEVRATLKEKGFEGESP